MAAGGSGGGGPRKLRPWLVAQAESGRFPGLVWDDPGRSALRIPWQHAGKGGARGGAGALLCQAWAEFKGRLRPGAPPDPAGWKTRLRCALNKSPELQELPERSRLDGPRPYKVYRLVEAPPPARAGAGQPPRRGGGRPRQEAGPGAAEGGGAEAPPHEQPAPPPDEAPPQEPRPDAAEPGEAPPPLEVEVLIESEEPLPPAQGGASLGVGLWVGGALAWRAWLPPGEYLLGPAPPPGPAPRPSPPARGLLPRLLLRPRPGGGGGALGGLGEGLLLGSGRRGLFLRRRAGPGGGGAGAGAGLSLRGPHAPPGALPEGRLLQPFDAPRFRQELGLHRAGLGPRPEHRVTLAVGQELGPHDGPHNRSLVLQLEQAFARELLDGTEDPPGGPPPPPCTPPPP